jgi:pSer/pThr/pTyr-binding forkhead associated (FHA) protein
LHLAEYPQVRLMPDQDIPPHDMAVQARHQSPHPDSTQAMRAKTDTLEAEEPPQAVLILGDSQTFPIDQPVLNLGRARDNHIVLDDPRVSRQHAQIRLRFGQHLLYDLDSMGGTSVNEQPIHEHVLRSGDVISLAGHTIVYLEEGDPGVEQPDAGARPTTTPSGESPPD